jgi:hypothetical protein
MVEGKNMQEMFIVQGQIMHGQNGEQSNGKGKLSQQFMTKSELYDCTLWPQSREVLLIVLNPNLDGYSKSALPCGWESYMTPR